MPPPIDKDAILFLYGDFSAILNSRLNFDASTALMSKSRTDRHLLMAALDAKIPVTDLLDDVAVAEAFERAQPIAGDTVRSVFAHLGPEPLPLGLYADLIGELSRDPQAVRALCSMSEATAKSVATLLALPPALRHPRIIEGAEGAPKAKLLGKLFNLAVSRGRSPVNLAHAIAAAPGWTSIRQTLVKALAPPLMKPAPFTLQGPEIAQVRQPQELVALGHGLFHNCLAQRGYEDAIEGLRFYFKARIEGEDVMICVIEDDTLGPRIEEMAGPRNAPVPEGIGARIIATFQEAGVEYRPNLDQMLLDLAASGRTRLRTWA